MRSVAEILKEVSAKAVKQSGLQAATRLGICFYLLHEGWDLTKEGTKVMQDRPLWGLLRTLCRQRNLNLKLDDKV